MRREENALEYLDRPVAPADLEASLADIDRLNAWFGGYALTIRQVLRLARPRPDGAAVVVDVGGGRGDLALRLVRAARRRGRQLGVVIVDLDADSLRLADPVSRVHPSITRVRADAAALPFREGGVDVATSSLMLHHLSPDAAVAALEAMRSVARSGVVVNDLLRTRLTLLLVWIATRVFARHPISRHDGPLSVRRSYSPDEIRVLCEKAGWREAIVRRYPLLGRLLALTS
jgi:ubiquinone/menaquinone biosynthesis C-methylase UbiE